MPTIKCSCGSEILVVPDVKAMSIAIENHAVNKHKQTIVTATAFLTEQVLIMASKINQAP
jgi:hypothetical protein